jgi:hypothetical protein
MVELRIWHSEPAAESFERALAFQPKHQEPLAGRGSSAAGNGATYTRRVEVAYRQFWPEYCAAQAR